MNFTLTMVGYAPPLPEPKENSNTIVLNAIPLLVNSNGNSLNCDSFTPLHILNADPASLNVLWQLLL